MRRTHRALVVLALAVVAYSVSVSAAPGCANASHEFTTTGVKNVTTTWCDPEHFDNATVRAHAQVGGDYIHVNRGAVLDAYDQRVHLHELGHTLGSRHSAGVMNYDAPDMRTPCTVNETTAAIARSFDGYQHVILDRPAVSRLIETQWAGGHMDTEQILWAIRQPRDCAVVYYASDFDMFGGHYDRETVAGYPVHSYDGYFYGLPSISA